jgi:hypothetical protein
MANSQLLLWQAEAEVLWGICWLSWNAVWSSQSHHQQDLSKIMQCTGIPQWSSLLKLVHTLSYAVHLWIIIDAWNDLISRYCFVPTDQIFIYECSVDVGSDYSQEIVSIPLVMRRTFVHETNYSWIRISCLVCVISIVLTDVKPPKRLLPSVNESRSLSICVWAIVEFSKSETVTVSPAAPFTSRQFCTAATSSREWEEVLSWSSIDNGLL